MLIKLLTEISSPYDYCNIPAGEYEVKYISNWHDYEMKRKVDVVSLSGKKISRKYYDELVNNGDIVEVQQGPELLPDNIKEEVMENAVAKYDGGDWMPVSDLRAQVNHIQEVMRSVMQKDEHYGVIPGCGNKPTLLKPGAEKLSFTFRLSPHYEITRHDMDNGHREYEVMCRLSHINTGQVMGEGVGSCSTMEGKYRYRTGPGESTGIQVPKKYWDTRKEDPAAAMRMLKSIANEAGFEGDKFATKKDDNGIWNITTQSEKVEHDNPADYFNTVLKMAKKRAHVDAILTATAASDIFTQDVEDMVSNGVVTPAPAPQPAPPSTSPRPQWNEKPPPEPKPPQPKDMATPKQKKELMAKSVSRFANQENAMKFITWCLEESDKEYWSQSLIEDVLNDFEATANIYAEAMTAQGEDIPV